MLTMNLSSSDDEIIQSEGKINLKSQSKKCKENVGETTMKVKRFEDEN